MISRLRQFLFQNLLLKVTALLIAVLMWYGVAHEPVAEISVRLPIEFSNAPKNLDYSADAVPQAQIRLRGPARLLRELPEDSMHIVLDLSGATPGEHTYDLNANQVHVPHEIRVIEIIPTRLHLTFDVSETRQIAVKPRIVGSLPPGYQLISIVTNPSMLSISGPRRHVDDIDNAVTDTVDISGVAGQATFEARAYVPDPLVHLTGSNAVRITVTTQAVAQPPAPAKRGAR